MRFTRKEDLTFFLMSKFAKFYGKRLVSLSEIALEFGISSFFLKQLVRPLVKARLLISKEGVKGGYTLAKKPEDITIYEIFSALSTLPALTLCCKQHKDVSCHLTAVCKPRSLWEKINQGFIKELTLVKLSQLA